MSSSPSLDGEEVVPVVGNVRTSGSFSMITSGQVRRINEISQIVKAHSQRCQHLLVPGGSLLKDANGVEYRNSWTHVLESAIVAFHLSVLDAIKDKQ